MLAARVKIQQNFAGLNWISEFDLTLDGTVLQLNNVDGADHDDTDTGSKIIDTVDDALSTAVDELAGENVDDGEDIPEQEPESAITHEPLYNEDDLKLFAIDKDGKLYIYGAGERITLKAGWQLIVLSPGES